MLAFVVLCIMSRSLHFCVRKAQQQASPGYASAQLHVLLLRLPFPMHSCHPHRIMAGTPSPPVPVWMWCWVLLVTCGSWASMRATGSRTRSAGDPGRALIEGLGSCYACIVMAAVGVERKVRSIAR